MENLKNILEIILAICSVFGISFVIEKSPIKVNPLTMIKKFLVGDITDKIDDINKKIAKVDSKVDENEADRLRETILNYRKGLEMGMKMSEHEYEYLIKIYGKYHDELKQNSFVTEVFTEIKELYKKQRENT